MVSIREIEMGIRECPPASIQGATPEKQSLDTGHWELCSELLSQPALLPYCCKGDSTCTKGDYE